MVDVLSDEGAREFDHGSVREVGPSRGWFAVAALLAFSSVVGGALLGIHGWRSSFGRIDDYPRVEVPDRTTVDLDRGEYTLYAEYPANRWGYDSHTPTVTITDPERDRRITVRETFSTGSYTMGGRRGVSMGTVSIPRDGRYQVITASEGSSATAIAFGGDVLPGFLLSVFGAMVLAGCGLLVAAIVVVVVAVMRSRARRRLGLVGHPPVDATAGAWAGPPMASWSTSSPWPPTMTGPPGQWASPSGGPSGPGPWGVPPEQWWPAPPAGSGPGAPPGAPGSWDAPAETQWPGTTPSGPVPWGSPPEPPGGPGCDVEPSRPGPSGDPNDPGWAAPLPGPGQPAGSSPGDDCSPGWSGSSGSGGYDSGGSDSSGSDSGGYDSGSSGSGGYDSGGSDSGGYDSGGYDGGGGDLGS